MLLGGVVEHGAAVLRADIAALYATGLADQPPTLQAYLVTPGMSPVLRLNRVCIPQHCAQQGHAPADPCAGRLGDVLRLAGGMGW